MSLFFYLIGRLANDQAAEVNTLLSLWSDQILNGLRTALIAIAVGGSHSIIERMTLMGHGELLILVSAGDEVTRILCVDGPSVGGIYII